MYGAHVSDLAKVVSFLLILEAHEWLQHLSLQDAAEEIHLSITILL
jgi:hypothetical protein